MSLGENRVASQTGHVAPRSPAPVLTIQPQPQADERERQADAGREENEIFRHLLSSVEVLSPIAASSIPPDVHSRMPV